MLRIAICDDEQSMIDFHAQTVKACLPGAVTDAIKLLSIEADKSCPPP